MINLFKVFKAYCIGVHHDCRKIQQSEVKKFSSKGGFVSNSNSDIKCKHEQLQMLASF